MSHHQSFARIVTAVAKIAIAIAALSSTALAIEVENTLVEIGGSNGNKADFGGGGHSSGLPDGSGHVIWDYRVVNGLIVANARVTGTLYLDDFFGGQVRINIRFLDLNNNLIADDASITITSPVMPFSVFGAADSNHQMTIDVNREASNLHFVLITIRSLGQPSSNGQQVGQTGKNYPLRIDDVVTFCCGASNDPWASVAFIRTNGVILSRVRGTLIWNAPVPGRPRLKIRYQDLNGHLLASSDLSFFAPGGDPNIAANRLFITAFSPASGTLWQTTLILGADNDATGKPIFVETARRVTTYDGGPSNGIFDLAPSDATVAVHERQNYAFTWTLPDPLNWHDLDFLQLRIRNGDDTLLWVVFDEASQTFALRNEGTGELGPAFPAGSHHVLQTPKATLHLDETSVVGSGPTGPFVTLNLSLSVKPQAAGDLFAVEVAATDDAGNLGNFALAGTLRVIRKEER